MRIQKAIYSCPLDTILIVCLRLSNMEPKEYAISLAFPHLEVKSLYILVSDNPNFTSDPSNPSRPLVIITSKATICNVEHETLFNIFLLLFII